ncbi:MAG: undecaprenyl-diphosphate phosphatase [Oscillospiraceae bacterium]|nr:undecaprenyl-diphosphate phosphatase [Oscillospiraceae bacterium]MBQ4642570.1 undecaprenyl-diphosphate phosphatase [Oscillospiraceae bacterium]
MSIITCIFYGFLSGIAEFLPVSSRAHQSLLLYLSGKMTRDPFLDLLVHIAVLFAILFFNKATLSRLRVGERRRSGHRQGRLRMQKIAYDSRLIRTASVPLIIGSMTYGALMRYERNLVVLAVFLILNGIILLIAEHVRHGNADASTMSGLDGIVMGICGSMASFPGISRTGMITSYAVLRGAAYHHASNWAVVLAIPAMAVAIIMDVVSIISVGFGFVTFSLIAGYFLGAVAAFGGTYIGITFLRTILNRSGLSGFAYYSLGAALFTFILYLIVW